MCTARLLRDQAVARDHDRCILVVDRVRHRNDPCFVANLRDARYGSRPTTDDGTGENAYAPPPSKVHAVDFVVGDAVF